MSTWLKDKEITAHFRVSVKTITRWAKRGMPRIREGSVVLCAAEDCEAWLRPRPTGRPVRAQRRAGRPRRPAGI